MRNAGLDYENDVDLNGSAAFNEFWEEHGASFVDDFGDAMDKYDCMAMACHGRLILNGDTRVHFEW